VVITNEDGTQVREIVYRPFGQAAPGPDPVPEFGFTGQRFVDSLSIYDYGARWYDPALGRFLQPDPVIADAYNPQNINPYSYVLNSPLNLVDPSGMTSLRVGVQIGGFSAGWSSEEGFFASSGSSEANVDYPERPGFDTRCYNVEGYSFSLSPSNSESLDLFHDWDPWADFSDPDPDRSQSGADLPRDREGRVIYDQRPTKELLDARSVLSERQWDLENLQALQERALGRELAALHGLLKPWPLVRRFAYPPVFVESGNVAAGLLEAAGHALRNTWNLNQEVDAARGQVYRASMRLEATVGELVRVGQQIDRYNRLISWRRRYGID
jgi:RHS repeat-associated protein